MWLAQLQSNNLKQLQKKKICIFFPKVTSVMNLLRAICWLTYLASFTIVISTATYTSVVYTTSGPIRGEISTSVRKSQRYGAFKGIPFAEPPLGYLRFKVCVPKLWSLKVQRTFCLILAAIFKKNSRSFEEGFQSFMS